MINKVKIAVVDDEKKFVDDLSEYLELSGYCVFKAYNGLDAMHIIRREKPDVALCDLKMLDVDGDKIVLYDLKNSPNTTCIVMTAYITGSDEDIIEKIGVHEIIYKPIIPLSKLNQIIEKIVKEKSEKNPSDG